MRAGKIDKRDHEIAKKPTILSICKQYVIWLPGRHVTSFYVGNASKINKKNNSNFAKINETMPVKKITIPWNV